MAILGRAARVTEKALASAAADTKLVASLSSAVSNSAKLPDLTYDYSALEPVISSRIMELHHSKHHQTYVTNLNVALEKYADAEAKGDVDAMIGLQAAIRFNGGGHVNHSIFWQNLAPASAGGGGAPEGTLAEYINKAFGDFDVRLQRRAPAILYAAPSIQSTSTRSLRPRAAGRDPPGPALHLVLRRPAACFCPADVQDQVQRADRGGPGLRVGLARLRRGHRLGEDRDDGQPGPAEHDGPDPAAGRGRVGVRPRRRGGGPGPARASRHAVLPTAPSAGMPTTWTTRTPAPSTSSASGRW